MYKVGVRDHFMIAHSFDGALFGPAQALHGATYVVDLEVARSELDSDGVVVDIGRLGTQLKQILEKLNYRNLDEFSEFQGQNTTTEFLARFIFERMAQAIAAGKLGDNAKGLTSMQVRLNESHIAWASFESELPAE